MINRLSILTAPFLLFMVTFLSSSCDSDKLPPPNMNDCSMFDYTYDNQVKAIIDASCAYTDCHIAGFSDGDFSTFSGMLSRLDNEKIFDRVIGERNMPPDFADGPTSLTDEQIEILTCWIENGYPEN